EIAAGWHVQPAQLPVAVRDFVPTRVQMRVAEGNAAMGQQRWRFPSPQLIGDTSGYAGTIEIEGIFSFKHLEPGALVLNVAISAQPCNDTTCLQPETATLQLPLDCQA